MKKSFYSIGSIIILLLAALIFVLIPATEGLTNTAKLPAYGYYGDIAVRYEEHSEFFNAAQAELRDAENQGYDFNSNYAGLLYSMIFSRAFQNTIGPIALEQMSKSVGYAAPETTIDRMIMMLGDYRDETGVFSPALYRATPDSQKIKLRKDLEVTLARMRSYQDMFGSQSLFNEKSLYGFKASNAEIEFIKEMARKEYSFEAVSFDMSEYPKEEQVKFGQDHKDLFVKYNVSVITCDSEAKAKECLKRISNSEITFEDAIAEYSNKAYGNPETGLISASYAYQLKTAVTNELDAGAIMGLAKEQLSEVISTPSGYSIFKCNDAAVQPDFTDDSIVSAVYSYLATREKTIIEDYFTNRAKDFVSAASVKGFDAACNAENLTKVSVPPTSFNYGNTSLLTKTSLDGIDILKGAVTNENFFKAAFKLKKDEISAPVVLGSSNRVVVLKCTDISDNDAPAEDTQAYLTSTIKEADYYAVNYAILTGPKVKNNSAEFMRVFNGEAK